jgi:hypothetical protein
MRFCAARHLVDEIEPLQPKAVCVLGATRAGPAAETVFRGAIGDEPQKAAVRRADGAKVWEGWAAVTVQPLRGTKEGKNRDRVARVVERLRDVLILKAPDSSSPAATQESARTEDA